MSFRIDSSQIEHKISRFWDPVTNLVALFFWTALSSILDCTEPLAHKRIDNNQRKMKIL